MGRFELGQVVEITRAAGPGFPEGSLWRIRGSRDGMGGTYYLLGDDVWVQTEMLAAHARPVRVPAACSGVFRPEPDARYVISGGEELFRTVRAFGAEARQWGPDLAGAVQNFQVMTEPQYAEWLLDVDAAAVKIAAELSALQAALPDLVRQVKQARKTIH
jgi:hypothetical protein